MKFRCPQCGVWVEEDEAPAACRCGGLLVRLPDDVLGVIVARWVADHDRGDEDDAELPRWTIAVDCPPIRLVPRLHEVVVQATLKL